MKTAWQVRAGRYGERDQEALQAGLLIVGWERVPDLGEYDTKPELELDLRYRYADKTAATVANWTGQLWRFSHEMAPGDLAVVPLKTLRLYAIGEVTGNYRYRDEAASGFRHVRPVRWLRTEVNPEEFGSDLLRSLSAQLTVCRLAHHRAPARIEALAHGRPDWPSPELPQHESRTGRAPGPAR